MPENTAEQMPQLDNVRDNATQEDFKMKNKVYELLLYAGPQLEEFPRAKRELAKKIDSSMLDVLRLVVALENKHYKKTTLGELNNEVDTLRHLVRIADFLGKELRLQLNKKTCIRPTSMGIEFVGFRIWSTHIKLRKKTAKKLKRRLKYMFAAYHAGEIDKDTLDRSVASYRGILQHFNSYGMRQSLNELYLQEMGKPYPEPEKKPASKCSLFCGCYGSADDYIKQPEEKGGDGQWKQYRRLTQRTSGKWCRKLLCGLRELGLLLT